MPFTFSVDPAAQRATIHLSGRITVGGFIEACRAVFSHPDWHPGFSTLWDATGLGAIVVTPEDVAVFVAVAPEVLANRGPGRTALVTRSIDVEIGLRVLALKAMRESSREFRVFGRLDEAERWVAGGGAGNV